ncbi:MAG: PLP-dependent aminotransferase family protein [SAR202 cluster bacterium]|nr:PLP-dependent aminotransferase family protein [SAR202 cluster bacterium]
MAVSDVGDLAGRLAHSWEQRDFRDLLSISAITIGAGSPTDAGRSWIAPTDVPNPIALAGGIPDSLTVPVAELRESLLAVLAEERDDSMTYGGLVGFEGLRESVARRQSMIEDIDLKPENFTMHNGSSGALDNICNAFLNPGDIAIVEGPSFSGTVRTIRGHMADVVETGIDEQGTSVDGVKACIERAVADGKRVKFVYVIPDFHNPSGLTMSLKRRLELLDICAEYGIMILEDAAYTELYFDEPPPPSMFALSGGQGVLRIGSFSKIIATGVRVGWVEATPEYIDALSRVRFDMGNNPLVQRALARYVDSGALEPHVERMRALYALKCKTLSDRLMEDCEPYIKFIRPAGGFFLWVECIGVGSAELADAAAKEGLMFPTGSFFFKDGFESDTSHFRLAFSNASVEELELASERMNAAFLRVAD